MTSPVDELFNLAQPTQDQTAQDPTSATPTPTSPSPSDTASNPAPDDTTPTPDTATPTSDTTPEATSPESTLIYPNVLKVYQFGEIPAGENPPGTLTITEFAGTLTVKNIQAGQGVEGVVRDQNLYQGVKAKRSPLPVVLVLDEGNTDVQNHRDAKVYLPVAEAEEAWRNRPARGEGSASSATSVSTRTDEEVLRLSYKAKAELDAIKDRIEKLTKRQEKTQTLVDKYGKWLTDRNLTWEQAEELSVKDAEAAEAKAAESTPAQ